MKNNVLVLILGVLVVLGLVSSIYTNQNVAVSTASLRAQVGEAVALLKQKGGSSAAPVAAPAVSSAELKAINMKLSAIESRLTALSKAGVARPAAAAGGGCGAAAAPADANKVYDIKAGDTPILGKKTAPVTITAFMDLQCPFCNRFYAPGRDVVKANPDKVNFVVKNYPLSFHKQAVPAAKAALAANEQGKYYEVVELLLANGAKTDEENMKEYAKKAGLNYKKWTSDIEKKDATYQKMLDADKALADQVAINGTPTFYINGKKTSARDVAAFEAEINKILAEKKK